MPAFRLYSCLLRLVLNRSFQLWLCMVACVCFASGQAGFSPTLVLRKSSSHLAFFFLRVYKRVYHKRGNCFYFSIFYFGGFLVAKKLGLVIVSEDMIMMIIIVTSIV